MKVLLAEIASKHNFLLDHRFGGPHIYVDGLRDGVGDVSVYVKNNTNGYVEKNNIVESLEKRLIYLNKNRDIVILPKINTQ